MSWIKRNLFFLVWGIVSVGLLGVAGYYFYSKWSLDQQSLTTLNAAYDDWKRISTKRPNPGNDKVDNIKAAKDQQGQVRLVIQKVERYFAPIPPIPAPTEGSDFAYLFRIGLRRTIDELQREAANSGVAIPRNYGFSFEAERSIFNLNGAGLGPLSVQLGEVRAICGVLFKAKVNSLEGLRREKVSSDDASAQASDYLEPTHLAITNDLAVIAPYEVTIRCFSAELASVLAGFASSGRGFIVKSVNSEPVGLAPAQGDVMIPGAMPNMISEGGPGARGAYPAYPQPQPAVTPTPGGRGLPTVLDEKPLKVTLIIDVVRLLPKK